MSLDELSLRPGVAAALRRAGIADLDQLLALNPRELLAVSGIGPSSAEAVKAGLARLGVELSEDPWAPYECARHGSPSGDTGLSSMYLCDACAVEFESVPFDGRAPAYVGSVVGGWCAHCNELRTDVRVRQWFLCGVCDRVVRSIGRGIVAARYVASQWKTVVEPKLPHLKLEETDPPELRRRDRASIEAKVSFADFVATDSRTDTAVLGVELKTGKSFVGSSGIGTKMARFQLDTSDCDDILTVVKRDRLPMYLMHAQVFDRADPPTVRFQGVGLWWTDLFAMQDHFMMTAMRPRETRAAAYYDTRMFRPFATFPDHLAANGPADLKARMDSEGLPELYPPVS